MKKLKSLKTLSSLGAIAAITPIVATACNSDDSSSTDENNIGSFYWSSNGDYLNNMSQDQIIEVFKANNVAGVNDLPEDIYSNVTITANQIEETWTSVTVSANSDSKYKGKKTVNITVKTALSDFTDWTERKGLHDYYKRLGTKTLIVATFILNHPAGEHGLPADIYDDVDVKASHDTGEWVVTITPKATCNKYIGTVTVKIELEAEPLEDIDWSNQGSIVTYNSTMTSDEMAAAFKLNNPEGQNGIPKDIYKYVDIIATSTSTAGSDWEITIKAKDIADNWYKGEDKVIPIVCGYMKYNDGSTYILPESIDLNHFCGGDNDPLTIPTKNGSSVNIAPADRSKVTELCVPTTSKIETIKGECLLGFSNLTRLDFGSGVSGYNNVKEIQKNFLKNCTSLTKVDLSVFNHVETIGDYFVNTCNNTNFTSLNLDSFSTVKTIGNYFLNTCSGLTSIDLTPLTNLETIGENFLNKCSSIIGEIDLSSSTKLTSIGKNFLIDCSKIESVNLDGLTKLTTWNDNFMQNCNSCREFKLSNLHSLTSLNQATFLKDCSNVQVLNLHNALSLDEIYEDFLEAKTTLISVDLGIDKDLLKTHTPTLKAIRSDFLTNCANLTKVDLSNQTGITSIGDYFLYKCRKVGKKGGEGEEDGYVKLDNLSGLKTIGQKFISCDEDNPNMYVDSLDLSGMTSLETVGEYFLRYNRSLTSINFGTKDKGWTSFKTVGHAFLSTCSALKSVDLSSFINVETIDDYFMDAMSSIEVVDLSAMTKVTTIGDAFLESDTSMTTLIVPNQNPPTANSKGFLNNCPKLATIYVPKSEGSALLNAYKAASPWKDSSRDQKMQEVQ